jgi:RNA polymerase sigma-70 factor (ECF subfamily)
LESRFTKQTPEDQLIRSILAKDKSALSELYDKYSHLLNGEIYKIVSDERLSSEILQNVFIKVWTNISAYSSEKERFSSWMLNISRKLAKARSPFNTSDLQK